jgi:hypothetical protein
MTQKNSKSGITKKLKKTFGQPAARRAALYADSNKAACYLAAGGSGDGIW